MALFKERRKHYALVWLVAFSVYLNTCNHEFVFDDMSAIKGNEDLRPETPFWQLFEHDFWGLPMHHEKSHKSYRPLTVLTFRLNYAFSELNATSYHITNVLLHATVSALFAWSCENAFHCSKRVSLCAALLFAVHPVHTEAVAGVVGRAELLSAFFFLLSLSVYSRCAREKARLPVCLAKLAGVLVLVATGTLCKEQCITVLAMFMVHDLLFACVNKSTQSEELAESGWETINTNLGVRWFVLVAGGVALLGGRLFAVQSARLPHFLPFDNPAASAPTPTRQLTYHYLLVLNSWLLACPSQLAYDWSMGSVPLVLTWLDTRNVLTFIFWFMLLVSAIKMLRNRTSGASQALAACSCVVLPYLPASNLFFPVGFVIAERVLYLPSTGFCLLIALGFDAALRRANAHTRVLRFFFVSLLVTFAIKTVVRNRDWYDDHALFASGLKVNVRNAKLWNNMGHVLETGGQVRAALPYFEHACAVQPDDRGSWYNVARTLATLNESHAAEKAYRHAIQLLPQPRTDLNYTAIIAFTDLKSFTGLARLLSNRGELDEAEKLLTRALAMRSDYVPVLAELGKMRVNAGRLDDALSAFQYAVELEPRNADLLYNLGSVYFARPDRDAVTALRYLDDSLSVQPAHRHALYFSAVVIQETRMFARFTEARSRLELLLANEPDHSDAHFQLAMLASHEMKHAEAERAYLRVLQLAPLNHHALFNLALMYSETLQRPTQAIHLLRSLLDTYPDHVNGHLLLGQLNFNKLRDIEAAEKNFQTVLQLEPANIVAKHHLCIVLVERGQLEAGIRCLENLRQIAPQSPGIDFHLRIARDRLANVLNAQSNFAHPSHYKP